MKLIPHYKIIKGHQLSLGDSFYWVCYPYKQPLQYVVTSVSFSPTERDIVDFTAHPAFLDVQFTAEEMRTEAYKCKRPIISSIRAEAPVAVYMGMKAAKRAVN